MQTFEVLVPGQQFAPLDQLMSKLSCSSVSEPFSEDRVAFAADLSRALSRSARGIPEIQALAFWMRKSAIQRLSESFMTSGPSELLTMPRGTIFHLPPSNVDTLFLYSFILALLTGNRNVVRLSSKSTTQAATIIRNVNDVLHDFPQIAQSTLMISYGHERQITEAITSQCDVRVIWGGDKTVSMIREIPVPPHAKELTFPDRFSMAAINAVSYDDLDDLARNDLVEKFFNDSYWFDQLGCSSPRLIIWVGTKRSKSLSQDFHQRLMEIITKKNYVVDGSVAIKKMGQSYRSIMQGNTDSYVHYGNSLMVLDTDTFPDIRGEFCGAGLFYQLHLENLLDLVTHIRRSDQTLATFGFHQEKLNELVVNLRGRGIDRIVPFGEALQFNHFWDGYDLLQEFTRKVFIQAAPS